jgi:hypothetical protein
MHDDRLIGGIGNDRLFGVENRDYLRGDTGIDVCLDWEIAAVECEILVSGGYRKKSPKGSHVIIRS